MIYHNAVNCNSGILQVNMQENVVEQSKILLLKKPCTVKTM